MVATASCGSWCGVLPNAFVPNIFLISGWRHGMQAPMSTQFPSMLWRRFPLAQLSFSCPVARPE